MSNERDIHSAINERAAQQQMNGVKSVRGTGEGYWSSEARAQRTKTHQENWRSEHGSGHWIIDGETSIWQISRPGMFIESNTPHDGISIKSSRQGSAIEIEASANTEALLPADRIQA